MARMMRIQRKIERCMPGFKIFSLRCIELRCVVESVGLMLASARVVGDRFEISSIHEFCTALGGQLGAFTPNCAAYSAFSRCQPSNFVASGPAMRPIGLPLRRRSRVSNAMCHPAAPIE